MFQASRNAHPAGTRGWQRFDADSIASAVVINMLTLAMPIAMMQIFDRVIPNGSYDTLLGTFIVLLAVLAIDFALKVARAHYVLETARAQGEAIGGRLSKALFDGAPGVLGRIGRERAVEHLMGVLGLRQAVHEQVVKMAIDLLFSGLFLLVIAGLGGRLVLAPVAVMLALLLLALTLRPAHRKAARLRREYDRRRMSFLSEVLQQAQLVKLLGLEQQMLRRYEVLHANSSVASERLIRLGGGGLAAASMGSQAAAVLTCAFGGVLAIRGELSVSELAACMLLTGRAVQPVIQLTFLSAARDDERSRNSGLSEVAAAADAATPAPAMPVTGCMDVQGIGLCRAGGEGWHFRDISFNLQPGGLAVIDGPLPSRPGCLLQILGGELAPDEGRVLLGGSGALDWTSAAAPPGLVFEPREPLILDGAIGDNLLAFEPGTPDEDLQRLAIRLGLSSQVAQLPAGLQSMLSATRRNVGSPGFYRRLSLVRALAAKPRILLLDQPFADLDTAGARDLEALLLSLRGTVTCVVTRPTAALEDAADARILLRPAEAPRA